MYRAGVSLSPSGGRVLTEIHVIAMLAYLESQIHRRAAGVSTCYCCSRIENCAHIRENEKRYLIGTSVYTYTF